MGRKVRGIEGADGVAVFFCAGEGVKTSLSAGTVERVVPCDEVQFRFLGISLAGYNALISAVIVALLLGAMLVQARRKA